MCSTGQDGSKAYTIYITTSMFLCNLVFKGAINEEKQRVKKKINYVLYYGCCSHVYLRYVVICLNPDSSSPNEVKMVLLT